MNAALLQLLSPGGAGARLSVLIFHRVPVEPDPLFPGEIDAAQFDRICAWLARWFHVMPLVAASQALVDGTLPPRALCITFDDGYADNHDVALPILQRHGLVATFFIAVGYLNGGRMWNDTIAEAIRGARHDAVDFSAAGLGDLGTLRLASIDDKRAAVGRSLGACKYLPLDERERVAQALAAATGATLPDDLMMSSQQVQALHRAGMAIGGHTVKHPILATLQAADAQREIVAGKQWLEDLLQAPVQSFAYPNGRPVRDYAADHAAMARDAGFACAVSTAPGAASAASDPFQIPRFTPWDRSRWAFGLRLARNLRSGVEARA
jgi:peptidoglycan/xylan/chitin deacetylase (PgdA/CDA1 family)